MLIYENAEAVQSQSKFWNACSKACFLNQISTLC